jgi:hypothetical protein
MACSIVKWYPYSDYIVALGDNCAVPAPVVLPFVAFAASFARLHSAEAEIVGSDRNSADCATSPGEWLHDR